MEGNLDTELVQRLERLQGFLELDPENISLLLSVGDLQHQTGDFSAAETTFNKVLELQPGHAVASSRLAGVLISRHQFDQAEAVLRALSAEETDDPALNHNLGIALVYQGKWDDALEALERAADAGVVDPDNSRYQAYCLHGLGRTEEALAKALQVLEQAPNEQTAGHVAVLQLDLGDFDSARRNARNLLRDNPRSIEGNTVLSALELEFQDVDLAAKRIELVLDQEPDNPRALLNHGLVQLYNKRTGEAIETFKRTLELMPRNTGVWVTLGWTYIGHDDLESAEETFRKAIDIDRNFGEAHGGLATTLALVNRDAEAREAIARARGLDGNSFGAAFALSILLEKQGKRETATRILGTAFTKSPREGGMTVIEAINIFARRQASGKAPVRLPKPKSRH